MFSYVCFVFSYVCFVFSYVCFVFWFHTVTGVCAGPDDYWCARFHAHQAELGPSRPWKIPLGFGSGASLCRLLGVGGSKCTH